MSSLQKIFDSNLQEHRVSLSKNEVHQWLENFYEWLFCRLPECNDYQLFLAKGDTLRHQIETFLNQLNVEDGQKKVESFFNALENIHQTLQIDLEAVLNFDPAAKSKAEVLLSYPGFFTTVIHRISHHLYQANIEILPRMFSEFAHSKTGVDIHPGASIGEGFFIDHGTGIVIGETAIIKKNVKIYQGVTLGALSVSKQDADKKRHPTIEEGVVIYANATILGGETIIGEHSVIGGNVWITSSLPAHSLVYHNAGTIVKTKIKKDRIIDFCI